MKTITYHGLVVLIFLATGCATMDNSTLVRRGYSDVAAGNAMQARINAEEVLRKDPHNPSALVLLARAHLLQNNTQSALEALEAVEIMTAADWLHADRVALHESLLLKGLIKNDMRMFFRAEDVRNNILNQLTANHYQALVQYHEAQNDPINAADAFRRFEQAKGRLSPEEALHGFVLYYSTLHMDDARRLWAVLTPVQRERVRGQYEDMQF